MSLRLRAAAASDVGRLRENNQDDLLIVDDALFVVADGMGGHVAGEVASREAVDAMRNAYAVPGSMGDVRQAVRLANGAVWQRGDEDPSYRGMGTTVTAVAVVEGGRLAVANVGDSRTYLLRDDELVQLTKDHSFVQEAVRSGQLTRAQAESHPRRSQLTRALGVGDDVEVDVDLLEPLTGDRLLLCSDGLWDEVGDELIARVLTNHADPGDAASQLVMWANEAGGRDNITVIVVDVLDGDQQSRAVAASAALEEAGETSAGGSAAGGGAPAAGFEPPARWKAPSTSGTQDRSLMQAAGPPPDSARPRLLTWRVLAFVVVLLGVLAAAAVIVSRGGPAWAVGLDGNDVVVRRGSTLVERKPLQVNQLPAAVRTELAQGKRMGDRAEAERYVDGITRTALRDGTITPGAGVVVPPAVVPPASTGTAGSSPTTGAAAPGRDGAVTSPVPGP